MNVHTSRILPVIMPLIILIGLAGVISACGKKGAPEPPTQKEEIERR